MDIMITGLTKQYQHKEVLKIPSLAINRSSLLGVVGPNGAGKSTLARLIAGVEYPTEGSIAYDGEAISRELQQRITLVFQKPYMLRTTVFNNIAYPLKLRGLSKASIGNRVRAIIEDFEIEALSEQNAWTLSGGEAQKVALARALVFKPSLLILDEPTANIDPASIVLMEKMIKKAHADENTTAIMVTHNILQAKRLCTDLLFMNNGKAVEMGNASKLFERPSSLLTKQFLEGELIY